MKTCRVCRKSEPEVRFLPSRKNLCEACRSTLQLKAQSRSPESFLTRALSIARNRAKGKKDFELELEDVLDLWHKQEGRCAISGVLMTYSRGRGINVDMNASIDRIDSKVGYVRGNVQLVANRVNTLKNDLDEASFGWWVRTIHANYCSPKE